MPFHLILCLPLFLLPSNSARIRVFSNESALHIRWRRYQSFSFSISPSNEDSGLISFRTDWFDLLAGQGSLKSPTRERYKVDGDSWRSRPGASVGSFPMSQLFASGGQSIGTSASVLPMSIQDRFSLGLTGLISLQSKGLSRVFSNTTAQKHQFFGIQPSLWSNSHIHT